MLSMSRSVQILIMLVIASALTASEFQPADAQLVIQDSRGTRTLQVRVVTESMEGVQYELGAQATGSVDADEVLEINYSQVNEGDYLRGKNRFETRRWEDAITSLSAAAEKSRFEHVRVQSLEWLAEAYVASEKPAEAAAALERLVSQFPNHPRVPEVLYRRGEILLGGGDAAAAESAFGQLAERARVIARMNKVFGDLAANLSVIGRADVARSRGDFSRVISLLEPVLEDMDPAASPQRYGQAGLALCAALAGDGRNDDALNGYTRLAFSPIDPAVQSQAHLERARLFQANGDTIAAFDAACMAAVRRNGDDRARAAAKTLARELIGVITASDLSDEEMREYRAYLGNL